MDIKLRFTIPLPEGLVEALGIDEETALEAYIEDGKLVVTTLDDDDFDSLVCDGDCDMCDDDFDEEFDDEDDFEDCPIGENDCKDCEFFCKHCGACTYDE